MPYSADGFFRTQKKCPRRRFGLPGIFVGAGLIQIERLSTQRLDTTLVVPNRMIFGKSLRVTDALHPEALQAQGSPLSCRPLPGSAVSMS